MGSQLGCRTRWIMDEEIEYGRWGRLKDLCDSVLSKRPLILASNRGPIEHYVRHDNRIEARRGSGGVVTALSSLTGMLDFTWVATAMGEGDRRVAEQSRGAKVRSTLPGQRAQVRYVSTPRRVYHKYYNVFCNPLLWFLQHYMWNSPYSPNVDSNVHDAWNNGYVTVNESVARMVIDEGQQSSAPPIVMTHDYHLYLAPGFIREQIPNAVIQHFTHIPWPAARYWKLLPNYIRNEICRSLVFADVVGFQSMTDVRNFLDSCEEFLPDYKVDHNNRVIYYGDRSCSVRAYPISVNAEEIIRIANSPRAMEYEKKLNSEIQGKAIVRVDRAEPSKNVIRGFRAFQLLLSRYPELHGKVSFMAFLVPSRTHIRQYQRYMDDIQRIIGEINSSYGTAEWQPIKPYIENNYLQAIAGMKVYDVLLINAVIDGMNLVAKEGPLVNTKDGVLILSETTGAHYQLKDGALSVSPADIEGTMQAMYQALTMSDSERKRRSTTLSDGIRREDISHWLVSQIEDLSHLV